MCRNRVIRNSLGLIIFTWSDIRPHVTERYKFCKRSLAKVMQGSWPARQGAGRSMRPMIQYVEVIVADRDVG